MGVKRCLFLISLSVVFAACGFVEEIVEGLPTSVVSPTPLFCPTMPSGDVLYEDLRSSSTLVVIAFDSERPTRQHAGAVIDILEQAFVEGINPGDRIVLIRMGVREFREAIISYGLTHPVQVGVQEAMPVLGPTATPAPTEIPGESSYTQRVQEQQLHGIQTLQAAEKTADAYFFRCTQQAVEETNQAIRETATVQIGEARDLTLATYLNDVDIYLAAAAATPGAITTPIPNQVYEGLTHASTVLENECANYDKCLLIIFDNLYEWRTEPPRSYHISLNGVEIIPVMLACDPIYEPLCQTPQARWIEEWESYGANIGQDSFLGSENLVARIIEFLRR